VESEALALRSFMSSVSSAKELELIILDACRENPFTRTMKLSKRVRVIDRGLARVEPNDNILVSDAAKPGATAQDDPGPHSVFAEVLLKNLEIPGLEINYMFRKMRDEVLEATNDDQEPAHYGSLSAKEIYLKSASISLASNEAETLVDEIAWSFLRESDDASSLENLVKQFPSSIHVLEARSPAIADD
jgi:uncharacterized caspase-like protein